MIDVKATINLLIALQEKDTALDALRGKAEAVPLTIEEKKGSINAIRARIEDVKKELTQFLLKRKQKEVDLASKEAEIRKHSTELNAVKTNDAYKALLVEIESGKQDKSVLESDILELMDRADKESAIVKEEEKKIKQEEGIVQAEVSKLEGELNGLRAEIDKLEAERAEFVKQIPEDVMYRYDNIRRSRNGIAIAQIEGENCSGCHIVVRPQLINEICKAQDIIVCDSCSRILFKK